MTTATPAVRLRGVPRIETQAVLCTVVLGIVAFCVVFPVLLVVLQSFQVAPPGQPAKYGLDGWRAAFDEPGLRAALLNTLKVTFVRQLLSLPLAVLIAWLLARTDLPGRRWLEFAFWAAFFLPSFTVTLSWILLLDPEYGLINTSLARLVGTAPFNIYSFWGIVWVHVLTGSLTVKVILLTPAFRHMNASFEEASRVAGASTLRTALRITVPVMAPVILSVLLLGTMVSLQTFEVEQVLGLPFRFFVFSTMIYDLLVTRVPRYDAATALAVLVLAAMLPLVFTQQWLTRGRRYTTITGQFQSRRHRLGPLRWPGFALVPPPVPVRAGAAVALPRRGGPAPALRDDGGAGHRRPRLRHAPRCADHQERADAARGRPGGGLPGRGCLVVGDLPAHRAAADGADPGRGRHDHVRGGGAEHRQHRAARHQRQPAVVDPAARLHRPAQVRGGDGRRLHHHGHLAGRRARRPPARPAQQPGMTTAG